MVKRVSKTALALAREGKLKPIAITAETVIAATADLPGEQPQILREYHAQCVSRGISMAEAAKLISRSENTLYQVWTGSHQARKDSICTDVAKVLDLFAGQAGTAKVDFIETPLTRMVLALAKQVQEFNRPGFLIGPIQRGKSAALQQVEKLMPGEAVYLSVPDGGKWSNFLRLALAPRFRISPKLPEHQIRAAVAAAVNRRTLIIADECHQGLEKASNPQAGRVLEYLRTLQDQTQCGLLICATPTLEYEMARGKLHGMLDQLQQRELLTFRLSADVSDEELDAISAAHGLPKAQGEACDLQYAVARTRSLGAWLNILRLARKGAHDEGKDLTWDRVLGTASDLHAMRNPQAA